MTTYRVRPIPGAFHPRWELTRDGAVIASFRTVDAAIATGNLFQEIDQLTGLAADLYIDEAPAAARRDQAPA